MAPRIMPLSCCRAMPKNDGAKKPASEMVPDQRWKLQVCYLCFYGFMTQIRPGESFITPYLLRANSSFTKAEVTNVITPVLSYSYMAVLVPIFLLTDYLRYKPVLVLQSLSHISIWLLLVLGTSVWAMQLMEFFYGITMAARIAYSSYIFSVVTPSRYQRMASYSRSAVLLGVFTSSVLGQLCVTLGAVSSIAAGYVKIRWTLWSELVIGVVTAFQAGLLLLMNSTTNIWLCYAAYILFRGSHQFLVPIAIFQIAASLSKELCALVFGVNTFFATVLKTIITIIVADKRGLGLSVHPQFYVYFGYFTLLAVVYLLAAIGVGVQHSHRRQPVELALAKEPCQLPVEIPAQEKSPEAGTV